jgi:hypothetical protein
LNVKVHERGEIVQPLPGWKGIVSASVSEPRNLSAALTVTDQVPVRVSSQRVVTQLFTPDILTVPEYTPGGIAGALRGPAASAVGAPTSIPTSIAMHPKSAPVTFRVRATTAPLLGTSVGGGTDPGAAAGLATIRPSVRVAPTNLGVAATGGARSATGRKSGERTGVVIGAPGRRADPLARERRRTRRQAAERREDENVMS